MDDKFSAASTKLVACEVVLLLASCPFPDPLPVLQYNEKPTYCISISSNFYLSNSIYNWKWTFPQMGNDGIAHWDIRLLSEPLWIWLCFFQASFLQSCKKTSKFVDLWKKKTCMHLGCILALLSCFFSSNMKESWYLRLAQTYHSLYHKMRTWTKAQL